ncbi:MAG: ankyrin repeat domain-containing protein [Bacteroidales bacterium]|jgi:ankyrin repeat protein|nr:ankyrin repeat domain-containing protein [Bacteroidales bacterium]
MSRIVRVLILIAVLSAFFKPLNAQVSDAGYDLLIAADTGSIKQVRVALLEGAHVNFRSDEGISALMYASASGHLDIVQLLIDERADVNTKPYHSIQTALYSAVVNGHVEIAELLILNGAKMNITNSFKNNLLHLAAQNYVWEMLDLLLYYDMKVDAIDEDNRTALHHAAFFGMEGNISVLLDNGANISHLDEDGNSALHIAAINGFVEAVKVLVEEESFIELKNEAGFTPLDLSSMKGHEGVAKYLLDNGAQINDSIQKSFNTLTLARKSGNKAVVKLLKSHGAHPNMHPYFNSMSLGVGYSTNFDDSFITVSASIHEDKTNIDFELRFASRVNEYQVMFINDPNQYVLYYEDRYMLGVGILKNFDYYKPLSGGRYGVVLGVHHYFSKSTIIGERIQPVPDFFPGFTGGLSVKYDMFKFGLNYEYLPVPIEIYNPPVEVYSPHRMTINFKIYLNFNNDLYSNVLI